MDQGLRRPCPSGTKSLGGQAGALGSWSGLDTLLRLRQVRQTLLLPSRLPIPSPRSLLTTRSSPRPHPGFQPHCQVADTLLSYPEALWQTEPLAMLAQLSSRSLPTSRPLRAPGEPSPLGVGGRRAWWAGLVWMEEGLSVGQEPHLQGPSSCCYPSCCRFPHLTGASNWRQIPARGSLGSCVAGDETYPGMVLDPDR